MPTPGLTEVFFPLFSLGTLGTALLAFGLLSGGRRGNRLYWGVFLLLVVSLFSSALDTAVLIAGALRGNIPLALQLSRLHELANTLYLVAIPMFFAVALPTGRWQHTTARVNTLVSAVCVVGIIVVALVAPDMFVSITFEMPDSGRDAFTSMAGRGRTGAVFALRDALLAVQILVTVVLAVGATAQRQIRDSGYLVLAGVTVGVLTGAAAVYNNFVGRYPGPLDGVPFSRVGFGLTAFALLSTAAYVRMYVYQARELDAANRELQQRRDRLSFLAYHDEVTQMLNKQALLRDLSRLLLHAPRDQRTAETLLCDLDGFRSIVDSYGFSFSDRLLRTVGKRIEDLAVRHSGGDGRAYHLEADQFAVVIPGTLTTEQLEVLEHDILTSISDPLRVEGQEVYLSTSAGQYTVTGQTPDPEEVLRRLKRALADAREHHNTVRRYSPTVHVTVESAQQLVQHLRRAVRRQEFEVHYQPIVDRHGKVVAAEALLRWESASPDEFIPLAESSGLIVPITQALLNRVFTDLPRLRQSVPGLSIFVNISARHLDQIDLVNTLERLTASSSSDSSAVGIEITETSFLHGGDRMTAVLTDLRERGFTVAIDDFGTGYSSLSYLKRLPADRIKIDRSFIADLPFSRSDSALVDSVITLGRRLGKTVVAEGVENREQHRYLMTKEVDLFQGFFFSAPLSIDEFIWTVVPAMELDG